MANDFEFESDWKIFRECICDWQTRYMERLLQEYAEIISRDTGVADRFWELEKRINEDKKKNGVSIYMRRSTMQSDIIRLLYEGAIDESDLNVFSDRFRNLIHSFIEEFDY